MRPAAIVEVEVAPDGGARLGHIVVGSEIDLLVLDAAPQPLDEDVVPPAPLPSMLIAMPLLASTPVKAEPVNCEPWNCDPRGDQDASSSTIGWSPVSARQEAR